MRRLAALGAALALGLPAVAPAGSWSYDAELSSGYDTNIGNAGSSHDRRDATSAYAGASANWEQRYGKYTALQVRAGTAVEGIVDLPDLSSLRAGVRARVLHKPGRGFYTPVLAAWLGVNGRDYGSDIRDGGDARAGLSVALPLTTAVQARVEGTAWRRRASGRVFDMEGTTYGLSLDWRLPSQVVVYAGIRVDEGDFALTVRGYGDIQPKTEHRYLEPLARAIEADPAFGTDWWAFGVNGRTTIGSLGVNVPLSPSVALDFQLLASEAAMGGFTYERGIASAGVLLRW